MAYKDFEGFSSTAVTDQASPTILNIEHGQVELPDASYVSDADIHRDGMNLILDGPHGSLVVNDYFSGDSVPNLVAPDGSTLTPALVDSFVHSAPEYAQNMIMNDESPVGAVHEISGKATITHMNGGTESVTLGTPVYQGDVIETDSNGAVNIVFVDETSFAVSEDARLAIDEYVFDPSSQSGEQSFSVLKGVFVFTSGLIGRDDPDDVHINTPVGSIGIRGTIIAGNVDTGEITVVEGAIVLRTVDGLHEMTLASQFETGQFVRGGSSILNIGQISAEHLSKNFASVSIVAPTLFSSINDAAGEQHEILSEPEALQKAPEFNADGTVDKNGDSQVDGTVDGQSDLTPQGDQLQPPPQEGQSVLEKGAFLQDPANGTVFGENAQLGFGNVMMDGMKKSMIPLNSPLNKTIFMIGDAGVPISDPPLLSPSQPLPLTDPAAISNLANVAPIHHGGVPPFAFLKGAEGQNFHFHFDKAFHDPNGYIDHFVLDSNTVNGLNSMAGDILLNGAGTSGKGWSFDNSNGYVELFFNTNFTSVGTGSFANVNLKIGAVDNNGAATFANYNIEAYNPDGTVPSPVTVNNKVFVGGSGNDSILMGTGGTVTGNTIFTGDGNDVVNIIDGNSNYVNLGDGQNTITLGGSSNIAVGGFNEDNFNLNNGLEHKLYGMDGDDDFTLISTALSDLTTNHNLIIDGGHSNFRAGALLSSTYGLPTNGTSGGRGDSLVLQGAGTLDFTVIAGTDNKIFGIERIDAASDGSAQTIKLNYNNVLNMTDHNDTLIINLGAGDTLDVSGVGSLTKIADNQSINDGRAGAVDNKSYDIFSDGNVTLLIHDQGGATVNFDGTTVAI